MYLTGSSYSHSSASFSRVNIGIHDLRSSDVSGMANSTLEQYSVFQTDSINGQGANILESNEKSSGVYQLTGSLPSKVAMEM